MTTTPTVNAASSTPASPSPPHSPGGRLKTVLQGNFRQYGMVAALVVIVILFQVWTSG
ncbi:MAG: putative multiple sugar transport system permease protein, partial [Mycobacterium sp.]|nr:putative multiple sugar transport system permease protein [Mycobacterium sp.]